ncbi:Coatomer, gamma subunit [Neoconidiobolus thromboides FSU 785]|nr:Coatomer, gamma subunit [Neoconidiobolus thromboides FSU 785]
MSWNKKNEEIDDLDVFLNLEKSTVLQEARVFNMSPIKPYQCRIIIAKILFLLYKGDTLSTIEATELFFSITKLFQSQDLPLRQIIYLAIKELSSIAQDVIIITSSLTKDMQPQSEALCRPNAIRALCKITDASMLPSIERFLKAAIVDKSDSSISSAALVSSYHLFPQSKEVIRRWSNEVQSAMVAKGSGFSSMVSSFMRSSAVQIPSTTISQYHALGLMALIRQQDKVSINKLVQMFVGGNGMSAESLKDPFAHCYLIRLAGKSIEQSGQFSNVIYDKLCNWLRNRNDSVSLEAAKVICSMPGLTVEQIYPAVRTLQQFLSSSKSALRFAAIRTINRVALTHANAMVNWKLGLDELISDSNRSVATFAITALLKIGTESTIDALIKQVSSLMNDISDEFRVIVVDAIKSLGIKFPSKQHVLLNFLSTVLRDEGGYEFKRSVVDAIIELVQSLPESKEGALSHLCEFIEDCEYSKLSVKILHFLGLEGPKTSNPTLYIRFIYNRVILETAVVRAAAVSALVKFAVGIEDLKVKKSIRVLLTRCLDDPDDEVRDRAAWSLRVMENEINANAFIKSEQVYHLSTLEQLLSEYCMNSEKSSNPFDIENVPTILRGEESNFQSNQRNAPPIIDPVSKSKDKNSNTSGNNQQNSTSAVQLLEALQVNLKRLNSAVPETKEFGLLLKSSPISSPLDLTEAETEYAIQVTKHIFNNHIVFEFLCTNTIQEVVLENLIVEMEEEIGSSFDLLTGEPIDELTSIGEVPAESISYNTPVATYVIRNKPANVPVAATFSNCLKFIAKECDPTTGDIEEDGFEDDYTIDTLKLQLSDYMIPSILASNNEGGFHSVWESLDPSKDENNCHLVETFELNAVDNLQDTVYLLTDLLGMQLVEGQVVKEEATLHACNFTGLFLNSIPCAAKIRMTLRSGIITLELAVRAKDLNLPQAIVNAVV